MCPFECGSEIVLECFLPRPIEKTSRPNESTRKRLLKGAHTPTRVDTDLCGWALSDVLRVADRAGVARRAGVVFRRRTTHANNKCAQTHSQVSDHQRVPEHEGSSHVENT